MVVPPRSAHPFGIPVVWDDVVVVRKLLVADGTFPVLLDNLAVQKFPHLGRGSEFPISPRVMPVVDTLDSEPDEPRFGDVFPATAGSGFVDRTKFITAEPHGMPPDRDLRKPAAGGRNGVHESLGSRRCCYNLCPRGDHDEPG